MKAIMLMFDSLNRHMLSAYGCDWVHTPNFARLARRAATFDCSYVGSMPCMPARRELHTGRCNFLHRSWGPLEPFDDSMPELLKKAGIYTHLVSDHYHYWEEGGATYHTRYNTWDAVRGQEGDPWIGQVADPPATVPGGRPGGMGRQDIINRAFMPTDADMPQHKTVTGGIDFIRRNAAQDNWLLHIETFDPHEPFFTQQKYKRLYPHEYNGRPFDWPPYRRVTETPDEVRHCRYEYAALVSMCDDYLGRVLDVMDELDLWKDTMLIVNTDHGFLLGEHESWAKCWCPWYEELARTPLFIHDPRSPQADGQRRGSLVQTIDIAPTLLEFFGLQPPPDMLGRPLGATVADDSPVRQAALFGVHGGQINITDGRYVYMRAPDASMPLYEYTLMPTHMRHTFSVDEMRRMVGLAGPFSFTKGCRVMQIPSAWFWADKIAPFRNELFDLHADGLQQRPLNDPAIEKRMIELMLGLLRENDAPAELYQRLGMPV
jgi:arylsulfatase A-like enzyme